MKLTIDTALKKGIEAYRSGDIQEADRIYTAILKVQPKHPDANHNIGILAVGVGKVEDAIPFFKTALNANPKIIQFWLSYIKALIKIERIADAKAILNQAKYQGFESDSFSELEQQLSSFNTKSSLAVASEVAQNPSQKQQELLISLYTQGQLKEIVERANKLLKKFPNSVSLYNMLGASYAGLGQFESAIRNYEQAIKIEPDYADAHNNLGVALKNKGDLDASIESFTQALNKNPQYAEAHYGIGTVLLKKSNFDSAIAEFMRAIRFKPDYFDAYNNIGNALKEQGKIEEAIVNYKEALKIKPNYADAFYNMGNAFYYRGDLDAAIKSFKEALKIKPDYLDAYNNMGFVFYEKDNLDAAIDSFLRALEIIPGHTKFYHNIGIVLRGVVFIKPHPELLTHIQIILEHTTYVRPSDICKGTISLLKFDPVMKSVFDIYSEGMLVQSLDEVVTKLSKVPLLLKLMSVCPIADIKWERFFKKLRSALLLNCSKFLNSPELFQVQSALALQCFTNEYVYNVTNQDIKALELLKMSIQKSLSSGEQPNLHLILSLASYEGLFNFDWTELLESKTDIEKVLVRQLVEPKEEMRLKADILTLKGITDDLSLKVRDQYELNPYPRWINLGLPLVPSSLAKVIHDVKLRVPDLTIAQIKHPRILVAGCGTGQHSIMIAKRFEGSTVLAIDLSLSSLAYAKRKTIEHGITNIKYMQADILTLGKLNQQFDIIESIGVLHHMNDPLNGWKVLTNLLRSGGLMKIGLYSDLARKHIIETQEKIKQLNIGSTDIEMRNYRQELMDSNTDNHRTILESEDFYSLSNLKDLLFHVQEHRFSLPQIKECLSKLGLKFCGFESAQIVRKFKLKNGKLNDAYDLGKWHNYEVKNPSTFAAMYQFWCQKL